MWSLSAWVNPLKYSHTFILVYCVGVDVDVCGRAGVAVHLVCLLANGMIVVFQVFRCTEYTQLLHPAFLLEE